MDTAASTDIELGLRLAVRVLGVLDRAIRLGRRPSDPARPLRWPAGRTSASCVESSKCLISNSDYRGRYTSPPMNLLDNLNEPQLEAVTLPDQSALILAGAGSGKTRVLTTRIAWLIQTGAGESAGLLAVTFTNKAAQGDADAALGDAADQHARHVGRHLPRPVQPHAARASPRRRPAAALPDPRHAGPARGDQAAA